MNAFMERVSVNCVSNVCRKEGNVDTFSAFFSIFTTAEVEMRPNFGSTGCKYEGNVNAHCLPRAFMSRPGRGRHAKPTYFAGRPIFFGKSSCPRARTSTVMPLRPRALPLATPE